MRKKTKVNEACFCGWTRMSEILLERGQNNGDGGHC